MEASRRVSGALTHGLANMEMPGGWMMSMMWMRMPDQTWAGAAASFLGMWILMMVAMMLPSLTPMLLRYRRSVSDVPTSPVRLGWLTLVVGCGYFAVWTVVGALAFPVGATLASLQMQEPALARWVPFAVGVVVLIAGALQFTAWKARQLACCRGSLPVGGRNVGAAWRQGVRLGLHCTYCCAGLTATLLVIGVMDWRAMAVVTVAITAERLVPGGDQASSAVRVAIGVATLGAGLYLTGQALGSA